MLNTGGMSWGRGGVKVQKNETCRYKTCLDNMAGGAVTNPFMGYDQ